VSSKEEIFSIMTEAVPQMLKSFLLTPYTEESAKQIAHAVVVFYNELAKKGFSKDFAKRLTEVYLGSFKMPLTGPQVSHRE